MLFGQLKESELEKVTKFQLPKDPAGNQAVLKKGKGSANFFLGCSKWGREEWIGKIYPNKAKERDFLRLYGQHYNSIELNATNYKLYKADVLKGWSQKVNNPKFKFCPKAHRGMSFLKDTSERQNLTTSFLASIMDFGQNLGPIFITHNEGVKWDEKGEKDFLKYLETLPRELTFFVEERWVGFFGDKKLMERYYSRLKELNIGTVITDTAGRQDVLHMHLTIPKAFIRFVGNSLHPSDYSRVDNWATRIKRWMDSGIEDVYFFLHMHGDRKFPELTQYVVQQFNKKCKLNIPEVKFVDEDISM
jgi:uncharacterized protein YecE (DUF72 family)